MYDFHEIWHRRKRRSAAVPNFAINFSEVKVKVKVHGQTAVLKVGFLVFEKSEQT